MIKNVFMLSKIEILFDIAKFKNQGYEMFITLQEVAKPRAGSNVLNYDGNDGQDGL